MFTLRSSSLDVFLSTFWVSSTIAAVFSAFPISVVNRWTKHGKLIRGADDRGFVPKSWFSHFYIYAIAITWLVTVKGSSGRYWLLLHLWRRLIEQTMLFPSSERSKMHVSAYLYGFLFYTGVAFTVPVTPCSVFLSIIGNALQFLSHHALFLRRWLRRSEDVKKSPPASIWFKYMNCPHYFAEMLIYLGLASFDSLPSVLCLVFVGVSLGVNWRNHSLYYKQQALKAASCHS
jgi:3-oxo-5-alpha-steroid 4-dehydrogenase 3